VKTFRILSIDGGGIKGVFPAAFLAAIERSTAKRIADHFDLLVGTSTGGIIALGLGLGFTAEDMLDFYRTHGPKIFPSAWWQRVLHGARGLVQSRYDASALRAALEEVFQDKKLGDATKHLVIPATSANTGDVYIYKTPHHPRFMTDRHETAVNVALATAAAPTYFPAHVAPTGVTLLDGGLWANNPSMVGVVEALAILDQPRDAIRVLSLGCTTTPMRLSAFARRSGGLAAWAKPAVAWLMRGQAVTATNQAGLLVGKENILRIQPEVEAGVFALDNAGSIQELIGLGNEQARSHCGRVDGVFLS
jgi:patatin-like phospholipase/acyl hydrolase